MKPKSVLALCGASANRHCSITLASAILALLFGQNAQGAAKTWVGNTSAALGTAANWSGGVAPVTGDSFVFGAAGSSGTTLTSALASFSVAGFTFNSGGAGFTIGGTAMTLTGNITNNSSNLQTINLNLATTAVRTINTSAAASNITLGGNITGSGGSIIKNGLGTLILSGGNSYTGATTVNTGVFQLSGAVGTLTASPITVNPNGTFISDNTTSNNNARIGDTVPITLNGGTFLYKGNAGASADGMGIFTLNGPSLISISTPSVTGRAQIAANSLVYNAGAGATLVNGIKLGSQVASTAGITQFTTTNAPTLVGTTAGAASGIASGTYNTSIVPFLLGEATATTGGLGTATGNANTFVTYSSAGGLRPLNLADEFDTSTTLVYGNNVRVTGATSVTTDVAINSMILESAGVSIDDGVTLTNSSGALMFSSTNLIAPTGTTGVLAFGSATAQITVLPTFTATISAGISGTGGLAKNGTGDLVLSGPGSYTGATTVNGGIISFTGAYTPSDTSSVLVVNNANKAAGNAVILNLSTTTPTSVGSLSGTNSTPSSGTNTSKIDNGGQLLTINQTVSGTFDGSISGAGGVTKTGSGNLLIGSNTTYTGPTIISGGVLRFTSTSAGSIASTSSISVASGATLQLLVPGSVTNTLAAPLTLTGNGSTFSLELPSNNLHTNNFTGGVTIVDGAIIRTFGLATNYNFNTTKITGDATTYGLTFRSEGGNSSGQPHTYGINVAADYTGNTTLTSVSQQGIIKLGVANALPTTTILTLIGSGNANSAPSLDLNGKNQTLAGLSAANATGVPRVVNSVATASTLTINSTANQTMAGVLGGAATNNNNFALTKTGAGTLSLSGANTYTGATAVNGGTLSLLNTTAKSTSSAFTVASGATLGLGVSAASSPYTSADVDSLFAGSLTGVTNHATSNVGIDTTGGNFTYATSVSSTRGLTKLGANSLTLSGTNTYSGPTSIKTGTLTLSGTGSISASTVITVGTGATYDVSAVTGYTVGSAQTLAGGGNVTGATIISGTHSPGIAGESNGVGTQSFSSTLDYDTGSIFEWDFNAASTANVGVVADAATGTYDKVVSSGAISGGSAVFKVVLSGNAFTDAFWDTDKSWSNIFSGAGTPANLAAVFSSFSATGGLDAAGLVAGRGQFSFNSSTSTLNWSAVPEPTSALAGLLIGAGLLRRRHA